MATVTAFDAVRTGAIEDAVIDSAALDGSNHLILTRADASTIDAGDMYAGLPNTAIKSQFVTRVTHDGTNYAARPSGVPAGMAEYVGPTEPTSWLSGDTWVSTA